MTAIIRNVCSLSHRMIRPDVHSSVYLILSVSLVWFIKLHLVTPRAVETETRRSISSSITVSITARILLPNWKDACAIFAGLTGTVSRRMLEASFTSVFRDEWGRLTLTNSLHGLKMSMTITMLIMINCWWTLQTTVDCTAWLGLAESISRYYTPMPLQRIANLLRFVISASRRIYNVLCKWKQCGIWLRRDNETLS